MITAIRAELLKVRTTRFAAALLAGAATWTLFVTIIESSRSGVGGIVPPLNTASGLRDVLTSTGFALILAAVCGATITSGEFRHQIATDTYLDEPNRVRVLVAKLLVAAIVGLAFGLAGTAITTGVGLAFTSSHGYQLALSAGTIARDSAGAIVGASLLAAIGGALGSLIRSQVAAIIVVLGWAFGVEQLVGGLFHSAGPYLPFMASATMAGAASGSMPPLPTGLSPLPFAAVVGLLAVVAIALSAVAVHTTLQRDVC